MKTLLLLFILFSCQFKASENLMNHHKETKEERGKMLIATYGCAACHEIRHVKDNPGMIGPPLTMWKKRKYIAGTLPNNKKNLIRWIMHPQEILPGSAMPDLGVTENEASDMAAYLYSQ